MIKVLYLIDTLEMGGAERSLLDIIPRLQTVTPVMVSIYRGDALRAQYEKAGVPVRMIGLSGPYEWRKAYDALCRIIEEIKPDVIHSTLFRSDLVARWAGGKYGIPVVNSLVNNSYHAERYQKLSLMGKLKLKGVQLADRLTASRVRHFISNSETIKKASQKDLALSADSISVIYRGRDPKKIQAYAEANVAALRARYGNDARILLNVSRLLERKGQRDLLLAFAQVLKTNADCILLIAGEGPYRATLERTIAAEGLTGKVHLLGTRSDIPDLLHVADVFVFPSHYEGLPGALIEAMLSGVPVIASNIPENKECVDADSAWSYPVGDVSALTAGINEVLAQTALAHERSAHAVALASEKFDLEQVAAQYDRVYQKICGRI